MTIELNPEELLSVRETAKMLGVHENTVRNWVKSGALTDARIRGSSFHRFRRADVERMRTRKSPVAKTAQREIHTIGPELIDGTQLNIWAGTKAAQVMFPELMRRLLAATPGVQQILIRAHEGVASAGYDGLALSAGSRYLPAGELRFEFGVDQKIKAKADKEWARHVSAEPSAAVFVFATPRRWSNAQAWADAHRAEGKFSDVWVIDADVLEGWLALAPAVHFWISEQLGRRPHAAQSLERWWDRFSAQTRLQLPVSLFLAGRNEQAEQLRNFLVGPAGHLSVRTEWANDAKAFVYAATRSTSDEHAQVQIVLVDTPEVWDRIIVQPWPAVLIPTFDNADVVTATTNGHHVILIIDQSTASTRQPDLTLARLERIASVEALRSAGITFEAAQRYAIHARRNLQAFVRSISFNDTYASPAWTKPPLAKPLAKLMLIGKWTTEDADIKLVERLVGKPWVYIEEDLEQVSGTDDPVFRKVGNQWSLTSPGEAFDLLAPSLKSSDMTSWSEVFRTCLLETNPTLDLSEKDRLLAAIRGIRRIYSSEVREGMARSAALLGARGHSFHLDNGRSLADHATQVLDTIFAEAVADNSGRKWEELVDVLPLLAEAAPQEFLDALDQELSRPQPGVLRLFQDAKEPSSFSLGPNSPHPWLLWAIETVTWSEDYLMDGIRVLTTLATLDPGGRTSNRPIESLATVLCGRLRNTSADLTQKIDALTVVQDLHPDVCWDLLLKLWPSDYGFLTRTSSPRIRDWQPGSSLVLMADWVKFTHAVVDHSIMLATGNPDRIAKLVEGLTHVPEVDQTKILEFLVSSTANTTGQDHDERSQLWERLHEITSRHERFSSAAWSFSPAILSRLKSVLAELEPTNKPQRFAYLFDWRPYLPNVDPTDDLSTYETRLHNLQSDAIRELVKSPSPMDGLEALAMQARVPSHVGCAMANNEQIELPGVAPWLGSSEASLREAGSAWFNRKIQLDGVAWLEHALVGDELVGNARALAIRSIPSQHEFWEVLALRASDEDSYWQNAYIHSINLPAADIGVAVERLVAHDRAWAALEVLANAVHPASGDAKPRLGVIGNELVVDTLNHAINEDPRPQDVSNMTSYYVEILLDYLAATQTDESTMARFEYSFFRLLEHTRQPKVLSSALGKDPDIFVDLTERVFRGKHDPAVEVSEREQQLANQAWWVLNGWKGFPGQRTDGTIDTQVLNSWVKAARLQFSESDRTDIGDDLIGKSLANSPIGEDGAWPAEPIRDLIETVGSDKIGSGFIIGRLNARGVTTRGPYEGGVQERELANQYRGWNKTVRAKWPRTARLLRLIADRYDDDARREDIRAELQADQD